MAAWRRAINAADTLVFGTVDAKAYARLAQPLCRFADASRHRVLSGAAPHLWVIVRDVLPADDRFGLPFMAFLRGGLEAEVAAWISEHCFADLDAEVVRIATPDVDMPAAPTLQQALLPSAGLVASAARRLASV